MSFIDGDDDGPDDVRHGELERTQEELAAQRTSAREQAIIKLRRRQEAYMRTFAGSPMGDDLQIVLEDIKSFCRGSSSPWHPDARVHALLTGRNEVYWRIMDHLRLAQSDFIEKYTSPRDGEDT